MFEFLKEAAVARGLLPGMTFETTLLGKVVITRGETGERIGFIPPWLQSEAHKNGFEVCAADYKRNAYTLRVLCLLTQMLGVER